MFKLAQLTESELDNINFLGFKGQNHLQFLPIGTYKVPTFFCYSHLNHWLPLPLRILSLSSVRVKAIVTVTHHRNNEHNQIIYSMRHSDDLTMYMSHVAKWQVWNVLIIFITSPMSPSHLLTGKATRRKTQHPSHLYPMLTWPLLSWTHMHVTRWRRDQI